MKLFLIALPLSVFLAAGASAQWDAPLTHPLACVAAVQQAPDPTTAADAYQRGREVGAERTLLNQSYVHRMIELGLPGQAEEAAEEVVDADPQDGVAWAVLAYCNAARNDTTAALAEMATAMDYTPGDPFVLGVAGKLMAWYRYPGLGDPSELPAELAMRLDEIHAQYSTNEYYAAAFRAASEFYASQAGHPIAERPEDIPYPGFDETAYDPVACTTYIEPVYSGFTVPCFSSGHVVPRVRTYVVYERRVHRHLRFHIHNRHAYYRSAVHGRRLVCERRMRPCAYDVAAHVRVAPPRGVSLPPPRARHTWATASIPNVNRHLGRTRPPPAAPRQITMSRPLSLGARQAVRPRPTWPHTLGSETRPQPRMERRPQVRPDSRPPAPAAQAAPRPTSEARSHARPDGGPPAVPQPSPRAQPTQRPGSDARPQARPEQRFPASPQSSPRTQSTPRPTSEARPRGRPEARPQARPPSSPRAQPAPRPRSEVRPQARPERRPQARPQPSPKVQPAPRPRSEAGPPPNNRPPPAKSSAVNPRRSR